MSSEEESLARTRGAWPATVYFEDAVTALMRLNNSRDRIRALYEADLRANGPTTRAP
jgi:hypothetical protein